MSSTPIGQQAPARISPYPRAIGLTLLAIGSIALIILSALQYLPPYGYGIGAAGLILTLFIYYRTRPKKQAHPPHSCHARVSAPPQGVTTSFKKAKDLQGTEDITFSDQIPRSEVSYNLEFLLDRIQKKAKQLNITYTVTITTDPKEDSLYCFVNSNGVFCASQNNKLFHRPISSITGVELGTTTRLTQEQSEVLNSGLPIYEVSFSENKAFLRLQFSLQKFNPSKS